MLPGVSARFCFSPRDGTFGELAGTMGCSPHGRFQKDRLLRRSFSERKSMLLPTVSDLPFLRDCLKTPQPPRVGLRRRRFAGASKGNAAHNLLQTVEPRDAIAKSRPQAWKRHGASVNSADRSSRLSWFPSTQKVLSISFLPKSLVSDMNHSRTTMIHALGRQLICEFFEVYAAVLTKSMMLVATSTFSVRVGRARP